MKPLTKPAQYRLPEWAHEFLAEEAARYKTTKTQVIVHALERLKESETDALMAEGYREIADEALVIADEGLPLARDILEEW